MEGSSSEAHQPRPTVVVGSPYFEDLAVGQIFDDVPAVTLTSGHAAFHAALFGDRLRLPLSRPLCRAVMGRDLVLAHPNLVCNLATGQTTTPSQRVLGNLFYRGLVLQHPVFIGDTLATSTEVVARRQNRKKPGRDANGIVVLQVHVENQHGDTVLHFWRCPMLPCRDRDFDPNPNPVAVDPFAAMPAELDMDAVRASVPNNWRYDGFRESAAGPHFADIEIGTRYAIEGDRLQTELEVIDTHGLDSGAGLVDLHVVVSAERGPDAAEPGKRECVLDWQLLALMA